ncbi:redoxin domain-containing protein [Brevibacillus sp. MS2.2]|uniref:TlpA family protein disulfide reductase n=1 Tax=Brevibacillus sp. MS2.2 TaxID=2738981 RepID=UPI00156B7AE5|nr:redoxin domain-containing protein [Brevibacillus sp. MS2.2]NRR24371.1 redoxin domain-containing protein [Brevibacillus sp. MS2.2]
MSNTWVLSNIFLWVIVLVQSLVIFFLAKYVVEFLNRFRLVKYNIEDIGIKPGEKAPFFRTKDTQGNLVKLTNNNGRATLLCFVSDSCDSCITLLKDFHLLVDRFNGRVKVITVIKTTANENLLPSATYASTVVKTDELFFSYNIQKTPTLVLIDNDFSVLAVEIVTDVQLAYEMLEQKLELPLYA